MTAKEHKTSSEKHRWMRVGHASLSLGLSAGKQLLLEAEQRLIHLIVVFIFIVAVTAALTSIKTEKQEIQSIPEMSIKLSVLHLSVFND